MRRDGQSICRYEDIEQIQGLVRKLREEGHMKVNGSCGLHIHVDGAQFDARTLRNLVNLVANKEDLIYRALNVKAGREMQYCKKTDPQFLRELNEKSRKTYRLFVKFGIGIADRIWSIDIMIPAVIGV